MEAYQAYAGPPYTHQGGWRLRLSKMAGRAAIFLHYMVISAKMGWQIN